MESHNYPTPYIHARNISVSVIVKIWIPNKEIRFVKKFITIGYIERFQNWLKFKYLTIDRTVLDFDQAFG